MLCTQCQVLCGAHRGRAPTLEEANLILIQMHSRSWFNVYGWQTLNDYLSPQQWTFPHGVCPPPPPSPPLKSQGLNPNAGISMSKNG